MTSPGATGLRRPPLPEPDPARVDATIRYLNELTDELYRQCLADFIMDPPGDPDALLIERAAFHSPQLTQRSYAAVRALLEEVNTRLDRKTEESGKAWRVRQEHYRTRVGMERRMLEQIIAGRQAQLGYLPASPRPRQQAYEELARRHPVEYLGIVREREAKIRQDAKDRREQRKRDARAAR